MREEVGAVIGKRSKKERKDDMSHCNGLLEDLPDYMVDNEYIKSGYRVNYRGFKAVLLTMFKCHNETFNIWSHFLGKIVFFALVVFIAIYYPNMEKQGKSVLNDLDTSHYQSVNYYIKTQANEISTNITFAQTNYLNHL